MSTKFKLPVELDIENQKILKIGIELEEILNYIEHDVETKKSFEDAVIHARSIISTLKTTFSKFQLSVQEWEDLENINQIITNVISTHEKNIRTLQSSFQKCCVKGQKRLTSIESNELFSKMHLSPEEKVRQRKMQKTDVANKSSAITENLINIARVMNIQVKQGEESNVHLENSSQQIKDTHEEFKGMTGFISVARKLLNKYNRRELTDTLLIFFGLILFFATVLYIISKRF